MRPGHDVTVEASGIGLDAPIVAEAVDAWIAATLGQNGS